MRPTLAIALAATLALPAGAQERRRVLTSPGRRATVEVIQAKAAASLPPAERARIAQGALGAAVAAAIADQPLHLAPGSLTAPGRGHLSVMYGSVVQGPQEMIMLLPNLTKGSKAEGYQPQVRLEFVRQVPAASYLVDCGVTVSSGDITFDVQVDGQAAATVTLPPGEHHIATVLPPSGQGTAFVRIATKLSSAEWPLATISACEVARLT